MIQNRTKLFADTPIITPIDTYLPLGSVVHVPGVNLPHGRVIDHQATGQYFSIIYHLVDFDPSFTTPPSGKPAFAPRAWVSGRALISLDIPEPQVYLPVPGGFVDIQTGDHRTAILFTDALIIPGEHTLDCLTHTYRAAMEIAEYDHSWPNHCPKCHGKGGEWDEHGEFSICTLCYGAQLCPRCGSRIPDYNDFLTNNTPCPTCHWQWQNPLEKGMARPDPHTCTCHTAGVAQSKMSPLSSITEWYQTFGEY